jgi:hypothetical protein
MQLVAKAHSQTYSINLTRVSVLTEDGSHQSSTFTHVHQGPVPKYHTPAYTKHKKENKAETIK